MKVSASIELIWQLAGQEAIAAKFKDIEPEHFFEALLKFSELPVEDVDKMAHGANAAQELAAEVNTVQQEFTSRSIDTTRTRRKLRGALGKGDVAYDGGQMHRSQVSRDLFDAAAKLAADAGSDVLTARYLLQALFSSPTPLMKQVIGQAVEPSLRPANTPLLDKYGQNIIKMLQDERMDTLIPRYFPNDPICRTLVQTISQKDCKCILIITEDSSSVVHIAKALAGEINKQNKRIISLSEMKPDEKEKLELLGKLLVEAAGAKGIILCVPPLDSPDSNWSKLLNRRLTDSTLQCLCQVTPTVYNNWLKKDRAWKKIVQAVWVHNKEKKDIPLEL